MSVLYRRPVPVSLTAEDFMIADGENSSLARLASFFMNVPTEINHFKSRGVVRITWDDGHVGEYAQAYLRGYCPCALCQGHGSQQRFIEVPGATLQEIRGVGNYAIELRWHDGHSTGIYTYDYLRHLCPCSSCSAERTRAE